MIQPVSCEPLLTGRLVLEPLLPSHAEKLFALLQNPSLYEFIEERPPVDLATLTKRYEMLSTRHSPEQTQHWLNWALRERETGNYLGYVQATLGEDHEAEIAYVLGVDYWGRGYAQEAVRAMLVELESRYAVRALRAQIDERNLKSISLVKSLGFVWHSRIGNDHVFQLVIASDHVY